MKWSILYHHAVEEDLESVGPATARRIVRAIDEKLSHSPLDFGASLSVSLANFRKLRVGDHRIVYQVHANKVIIFVLAVGPRRDKEVYREALKRK